MLHSGFHGTRQVRIALERMAAFALLWWVLTEGDVRSWGVGLACIGLALVASFRLWPTGGRPMALGATLAFIRFFLTESVRAGLQVAAMALRPRLDLAPAVLQVPLMLPPGPATVLLVNTLSLLPGTLSVGLGDGYLRLHVLDRRLPLEAAVRATERHIARMLKITP